MERALSGPVGWGLVSQALRWEECAAGDTAGARGVLAAILAGARDRTKGTCTPRHISPCGCPAAQISYLKPEQICREQRREQACNINQLSLLRILIKQVPEAQAWEGRLGAVLGGRWQPLRHFMSLWARGLAGRGKGLSAAARKVMLWVKTSSKLLAASNGPSGLVQDAGSAGLSKDICKVGLFHDPQSQVASPPHWERTKTDTECQTQGRTSSQE